jgi:hypothetical protein
MPVDTLNMLRQAMASPVAGGNPYARRIAGLLGPEMQTGSSDYFAQQMGLPQGEGLLYEGARMVSPSPTDLMTMARRVPIQELITYHGTPHRFEPTPANPLGEFDASKIGTGEGAQMRGHGIYVAEARGTAEEYAKTLANRDMDNQGRLNAHANAQRLAALAGDPEYAADDIRFALSNEPDHPQKTLLQGTLAFLESGDFAKPLETKGSLYTADLPDEMIDRMLDWDKPLSEQAPEVQPILREMLKKAKKSFQGIDPDGNPIAGQVHHLYAQHRGGNAATVAEELRSLGIPGIKYLDQGSRDSGKGTRNFVVFPGEEKKVKILKRD